jgi:hypothetical protein
MSSRFIDDSFFSLLNVSVSHATADGFVITASVTVALATNLPLVRVTVEHFRLGHDQATARLQDGADAVQALTPGRPQQVDLKFRRQHIVTAPMMEAPAVPEVWSAMVASTPACTTPSC